MRARIVLGAVALLGMLTVGGGQPAEAVGGASATVSCTANFPWAPNPGPNWMTGGSCTGSAVVAAGGVDDSLVPYTVAGLGNFGAGFKYKEPCLVAGGPAILYSLADGNFAAGPFTAVHGANVTTASVTGHFVWTRIGLNPVIQLDSVLITFGDGGASTVPGIGVGTASFIPPGNFNYNTQLFCGQTGGPLSIGVVAEVVVSA